MGVSMSVKLPRKQEMAYSDIVSVASPFFNLLTNVQSKKYKSRGNNCLLSFLVLRQSSDNLQSTWSIKPCQHLQIWTQIAEL